MNPIYELLRSDGSIVVNKKLCHAIGTTEAIIFSELISKYYYFESRGMTEDGFFFCTSDNLFSDTSFTSKQQRLAISNLVKLGLVETVVKGLPAKKYFKISQNMDKVSGLLDLGKQNQQLGKKVKTCIDLSKEQINQKGKRNNTNQIILKNNTNTDYIILAQNDDPLISFYLSVYAEYFDNPHPTLTQLNFSRLENILSSIRDTVEYEDYCDAVVDYFENLPKNNNGSIVSFMYACFRYFDVNTLTVEGL